MPTDIRQLVDACLAEQPDAMAFLVDRFRGRVLGLCYRMLGHWQDAEDAAQETFLRVSRSLPSWDSRREFEPWLLAIAANRCRTRIARRKKQIAVQPLSDQHATDWSAAGQRRADCLAEEVDRILATLPAPWSHAFRLFHQDGLAYQQIAEQLGRPVGTVKTWVHRSRLTLLEQLRRRDALTE